MEMNEQATAPIVDLIPLDDIGTDTAAQRAAKDAKDSEIWRIEYIKLLRKSVMESNALIKSVTQDDHEWRLVCDPSTIGGIMFYERQTYQQSGYYTYSMHAVFDVRPERYLYVLRDHNWTTRKQWETTNYVTHVNDLGSFDMPNSQHPIRVVRSDVTLRIPLMWTRVLLGVDWYYYDADAAVFNYVFRTTQHSKHRCEADKVAVIALIGVVIRQLTSKKQCEVRMVMQFNPGDSVSAIVVDKMKMQLPERMRLYATVAAQWDKYYGTKNQEKQSINNQNIVP